jgi:hypothetical protein
MKRRCCKLYYTRLDYTTFPLPQSLRLPIYTQQYAQQTTSHQRLASSVSTLYNHSPAPLPPSTSAYLAFPRLPPPQNADVDLHTCATMIGPANNKNGRQHSCENRIRYIPPEVPILHCTVPGKVLAGGGLDPLAAAERRLKNRGPTTGYSPPAS